MCSLICFLNLVWCLSWISCILLEVRVYLLKWIELDCLRTWFIELGCIFSDDLHLNLFQYLLYLIWLGWSVLSCASIWFDNTGLFELCSNSVIWLGWVVLSYGGLICATNWFADTSCLGLSKFITSIWFIDTDCDCVLVWYKCNIIWFFVVTWIGLSGVELGWVVFKLVYLIGFGWINLYFNVVHWHGLYWVWSVISAP